MQISIWVFFQTASTDFVYRVIASILRKVSCIAREDAELEGERVCHPPPFLKDPIRRLLLVAVSLGHASNWMKIIHYQYNSIFLFFSF